MIKYLLDTNILIGMYQHAPDVIALFQSKQVAIHECAYSSVTRMEILGFMGISKNEIQIISILLKQITLIHIDIVVEDKTIMIKQRHKIKLPDAIILATATVNKLELLTLDKKLVNTYAHLRG